MPLPAPQVARKLLHTRTITCRGCARADGRWDIDGWITDIKTYDVNNIDRNGIPAGEPVHGMGVRMTIDLDLNIHDSLAQTDYAPFSICPNITPNFARLTGLNLGKGFSKAVRNALGGIQGCVHLVDLLGPMATTAYQTLDSIRYKAMKEADQRGELTKPFFVDACHSWASNSDVVRREFPSVYRQEG